MRATNEFRIVVASPGDVAAERDAVDEIAAELNRHVAKDKGITVSVTRWETDTTPGFDPNGPQFWIDPALDIPNCDLLIGIFWKRFGTPVKDAGSGTAHEFNTAFEAWKQKREPQIWFYFSQQPFMPTSAAELEQMRQVLEFKAKFPPEGLYWTYPDAAKFRDELRNHLTQYLLRVAAQANPLPVTVTVNP